MATNYIAVRVDDESNAEAWWDALTERYPNVARSLRRNDAAVISAPLYDELAALPGFEGGPEHAPCALIDCGGEGDQWADVVAGRHEVFDALS
jgi:hypothetical protein